MQNRFTLLIILLSQAFLLFGQSVEISPNHPNPNDCIYIYTQAFTANLSFQSESQIIEEGNNITIETCFHESPLNATESHYDTIALGPMSEGVYTINYLVSIVRGNGSCEDADQNSAQIEFEVKNNSLPEMGCHELEVNAYPNPIASDDILYILANETISQVDVFDATGSFISRKTTRGNEFWGSSNYLFPVPGMYFLRINGNSPNSVTVKVIKI